MAPPPCRAALTGTLTLTFVILAAVLHVAAAAPYHELDPSLWASDQDHAGRGAVMPVSACTVEDQEEGCEGDEVARRRLGGGNYIGYDALRRNAVPCSYRGASYYNCRPGAPANPYSRGCSSITRCRG